jgi:hypothetical protein
MSNKGLLTIIAVILVGIFAVILVQMNQEPDTFGEQVNEAIEEVGDEIDDNTTAR